MNHRTSRDDRVLGQATSLSRQDATRIVTELSRHDVAHGGVWNVTATLWQRYDRAWDGPSGSRGTALLLGSIGVMYDSPARHQITLYRTTVTEVGLALGWTPRHLCDDALGSIGRSIVDCPTTELVRGPAGDPFRRAHR